jgi:hypothetical protein
MIHPGHVVAHCRMVYARHTMAHRCVIHRCVLAGSHHQLLMSGDRLLGVAGVPRLCMLRMTHRGVGRVPSWVSMCRAVRRSCFSRWQLVLHAVVLGAHGNWLNIHAVPQVLQAARRRGLHLHMCGVTRSIRWCATASSTDNHLLDCFGRDHAAVIGHVDTVVCPIEMYVADMWLCPQCLHDGVRAFKAVDVIETKRSVLFRM